MGPQSDLNRTDFRSALGRTRLATGAAISFERLWPLLLPVILVVALFATFSWFGLFRLMPGTARLAAGAVFGLAGLAALYPLTRFRRPTVAEIDRRIEAANRLQHTPVLVQTDTVSRDGSPFARALWREHQRRMAERLNGLGGDLPRTGVPERDPWGLRAAVALLFVTAFAFSLGPLGGRLGDAFRPHSALESVPPRIDAWVTPPPYTRKAPIFLTAATLETPNGAAATPITVPEGSDVTVRVTGGSGTETLAYVDATGTARDFVAAGEQGLDPSAPPKAAPAASVARQFSGKLATDGTLVLKSGTADLRSWIFAVTDDQAPTIRFTEDPKRAANGTLELNYEVVDDYGAASAQSAFMLDETQKLGARPLYGPPEMPLSLPRHGGQGSGAKASRDLTEHVWAGHAVRLQLKATDDAGQQGESETKSFTMPERPFTNPLAKALIEQRGMLALDANSKPDVLTLMDAITLRPEDTFDAMSHYLGIMSARSRLKMAETDDQLRDVVSYLWEIAVSIEDGDLSAAEKRLRQAQENLKNALENGASDEELDRLMKELREAMNDFLREFAERAQRDPNMSKDMPQQNGRELRQSDLQKMLDQIENLAKSGNRDKAKEMLSQLQDMMNNLQAGRQQRQRQGENGQQSEMRQKMDKLGDIMRRQQEMMNETFRLDQMQRGNQQRGRDRSQQRGDQGEMSEGEQGEGQNPGNGMTQEQYEDALRQLEEGQGKLQGELGDLMKDLEGLGIQPGDGFGEADEAMGEAEGALGESDGDRAVGEQGRALDALRRGAQDMMQQMQQAMQGDEGGSEEGGRQQSADRDPLGRPRATNGPDFGDSVKVPDEIDVQRARQILEAIRKRLGNALSPEIERSYLERLLDLR
jgi:uncharacterized protein (TIGR02302 family)